MTDTSKLAENLHFFTLLTSTCPSRHNGLHFFNSWTTFGGPRVARTCGNFNILTQNVFRTTTARTFSTSQLPKVLRDRQFLTLFTSKFASRHNGMHFLNISTSKSGPTMVCVVHFDLETCFAPQWCALFRHLNFQKWSDHGVL